MRFNPHLDGESEWFRGGGSRTASASSGNRPRHRARSFGSLPPTRPRGLRSSPRGTGVCSRASDVDPVDAGRASAQATSSLLGRTPRRGTRGLPDRAPPEQRSGDTEGRRRPRPSSGAPSSADASPSSGSEPRAPTSGAPRLTLSAWPSAETLGPSSGSGENLRLRRDREAHVPGGGLPSRTASPQAVSCASFLGRQTALRRAMFAQFVLDRPPPWAEFRLGGTGPKAQSSMPAAKTSHGGPHRVSGGAGTSPAPACTSSAADQKRRRLASGSPVLVGSRLVGRGALTVARQLRRDASKGPGSRVCPAQRAEAKWAKGRRRERARRKWQFEFVKGN